MPNILHDIPESRITPEDFLAYIEISAHSKNKYEYDEECRCLVRAAPIGVLEMIDGGKSDEKIIAVCLGDPIYAGYRDIHELPPHLFEEIRHFFSVYKQLEFGKATLVEGFLGREEAIQTIARAKERYHQKFE